MLQLHNGPMVNQQNFAPVPPHLQLEDDLDPPNLQEWIDFLNNRGNPNELVWGYSIFHYILNAFSCGCFNDELEKFSILVDLLLRLGTDPNEKMPEIWIKNEILSNVSCLHIIYIFWKSNKWNAEKELLLENLFDRILQDPGIDVRQVFSQEYSDRKPDWDSTRSFDFDYHVSLRNLLEEANLLHYASLIGDTVTVDKLLSRDPDLIHSECSTVTGKNLLASSDRKKIDKISEGVIAFATSPLKDFSVFSVESKKGDRLAHCRKRG